MLYRLVYRRPVRAILQLGIPHPGLTRRLLGVAAEQAGTAPIAYTGIDLFEARDAQAPRLALKEAFAMLRQDRVRIQLVPGDPDAALARVANFLGPIDLVLISADQEPVAMARAWRWLPRLLGPQAVVMIEESRTTSLPTSWRPLTTEELHARIAAASQRRQRAA